MLVRVRVRLWVRLWVRVRVRLRVRLVVVVLDLVQPCPLQPPPPSLSALE